MKKKKTCIIWYYQNFGWFGEYI